MQPMGIKSGFMRSGEPRGGANYRRMGAVALAAVLAAVSSARAAKPAAAKPTRVTRAAILQSINRGVAYLLAKEKPKKFWEIDSPDNVYWGGQTALALYALLEVGQTTGDPQLQRDAKRIAPALHWLDKIAPKRTYVASLQISALTVSPGNSLASQVALARATQDLLESQRPDGAYHYGIHRHPSITPWDNSNSQYGLLGVWQAQLSGMQVPTRYWVKAQQHWRSCQNPDGGWPYDSHGVSTRAMTAAGLTSLYVVDQYLHSAVHRQAHADKNIQAGIAWLAKNIKTNSNMYYLYGVERVGLAGGIKQIGPVDWYQEGAKEILKTQNQKTGGWDGYVLGVRRGLGGRASSVATAYALLFLTRGLNPVVFEKLDYPGNWNPRARDDANVTQWLAHEFEQPLNWSIVNVQSNPQHWLTAPVLLMTGSADPHFTTGDIRRLRYFVEHGGLIFSVATGHGTAFTDAVKRIAAEVVRGRYAMTAIGATAALRHVQFKIPADVPLWGLSNGVRYLWIHSPGDMSAAWQSNLSTSQAMAFDLAANVYFYATGKHRLTGRLHPLRLPRKEGSSVRRVQMAMLRVGENWNPEPAAWPRLAQIMAAENRTTLILKKQTIKELNAQATPLAHLTGTGAFHVPWRQETQLHLFLSQGGTLFADAAGGSRAFARSFRRMVVDIYPTKSLVSINLSSAIYAGSMPDSHAAGVVKYRRAFISRHGYSLQPRLLGIRRHGRWVIIFSPQDITGGLVGLHTWGIDGYEPKSAQTLAANIVLYSVEGKSRKSVSRNISSNQAGHGGHSGHGVFGQGGSGSVPSIPPKIILH